MEKITFPVNPPLKSIRDLAEEDVSFISNYWFHSLAGSIEAMGVDPKKLPSQKELETDMKEKCRIGKTASPSKLNAVAILCDGEAVGFRTISPVIERDHGILHARIWDAPMRGKGIASVSYAMACQLFMRRFDLKRILFKTPALNTGAIRVKEKLAIRYLGEETVGGSNWAALRTS